MLKLYDYFRSSACFRVRIALALKNLNYTAIPIHLVNNNGEQHSDTYTSINPQQLVPTLLDGQHSITQSLAIIEYLNQQYPTPPLLSNDPVQTAQIRAFALAIAADIHPINNLRVLNYLTNEFKISTEQKSTWYQHWIRLGFDALEMQLSQQTKRGKFCFGDYPTLADVCLYPQLYNARRFSCPLDNYPNLLAVETQCRLLDAFQKTSPEAINPEKIS